MKHYRFKDIRANKKEYPRQNTINLEIRVEMKYLSTFTSIPGISFPFLRAIALSRNNPANLRGLAIRPSVTKDAYIRISSPIKLFHFFTTLKGLI